MKLIAAILLLAVASGASAGRELQQSTGATGLSLSFVPEYDFVPVVETEFSHVITIQAPETVSNAERAPVSLTAVLDRSGSMSGSKIDLVKRSTEFIVSTLQEGDSMGVVSYSNRAVEDVELTPITPSSKDTLNRNIDRIVASGGTNLSDGLFKGVDQQINSDVPDGSIKSVLVLTDGIANQGITDITTIKSMLGERLGSRDAPIVYTLGFGSDHDAEFLQEIANTGEGSYVFIEDESEIASSFGDIIGALLTVTAERIKVTLTPKNGATIRSMRGGQVTPSEPSWTTEFPNLFAGEKRDILIDMRLPFTSRPSSAAVVLEAQVDFFDVVKGQDATRTITVVVDRRRGPKPLVSAPVVELTRLRFQAAEDITRAIEQKEAGDTEGATATLDATLAAIQSSGSSNSSELVALRGDVEDARDTVSQEDVVFGTAQAASLSSGAVSLSTQRGFGATNLAMDGVSEARAVQQSAAAAFVGGRK